MKHILVTGNGKSGSWKIRGEQLGEAVGTSVVPHATEVKRYDLAVLVKRIDVHTLSALTLAKVPFVWDIVDAWPQPHGNLWGHKACLNWLGTHLQTYRPAGVVAATQAMADDIAEVGFKGPVLTLPHHARPGQVQNPIRRVVETVGYEGGAHYLGKWQGVVESECARRGWRFVLNPSQLADLDIVLALREADGYAVKNWKSNVKLANAQGSGTPFIGNREAGYRETCGLGEVFADTAHELREGFDFLGDATARHHAAREMLACAPRIEALAPQYRDWLETL
jgi:hypothetical protein